MISPFHEERDIEALSEALRSDSDVETRIVCCISLARIGNPKSIPILGYALLNDPDPQVRWACVRALTTLQLQTGTPYLADALRSEQEAWLRARIAAAIGIIYQARAMNTTSVIRIVVASPADVSIERNLLGTRVIPELNQSTFHNTGTVLQLNRWEELVPPGFHREDPQAWIDRFLQVTHCQILICIFWKRFGFPTPDGSTGTAHEFLSAYEVWKQTGSPQLMIYFKEGMDNMPSRSEMEQIQQVLDFREKLQEEGQSLYRTYRDETDFEGEIRRHLTQMIQSLQQNSSLPVLSRDISRSQPSSPTLIPDPVSQIEVLLVTVTKVETQAVLQAAWDLTGNEARKRFQDNLTYYQLGIIGGANTWLVFSEMGSGGMGGSILTISEAIRELSPKAVIMIGIAFGVDPEKQPIGQILVSRQILDYELQKIDNTDRIIPRGDRPQASARLINRFRDADLHWQGAEVKFGLVLSGSKLIDNVDFRDRLRQLEPEAIGGEMEGAGLYAAAAARQVEWILVKAICDYADGNKRQNKQANQAIAAQNAAQFVLYGVNSGGLAGLS